MLVIGFPGNNFNGKIIPEIQSLVERGVITVVDGLLASRTLEGDLVILEFGQDGIAPEFAMLQELLDESVLDLLTSEDVDEFAEAIEPGSSAALLVFEHRWAKPLRDAIVDSGGVLVADLRIPGVVVEEVLGAAV